MKNTIKKVMPMRLVTLVRCVKSHRAEGKMDMILGGLKDFQCQISCNIQNDKKLCVNTNIHSI